MGADCQNRINTKMRPIYESLGNLFHKNALLPISDVVLIF